jgi:hypothetical protein
MACIDALLGIVKTAAALWFMYKVHESVMGLRGYGPGNEVMEWITVALYFAPNAVLYAIAWLSMWRRWSLRWLAQVLAAFSAAAPVIWPNVPQFLTSFAMR